MPNYIECTNCKTQNSPLTIKCLNCGSFIQTRVPNLDLMDTIWGILEKPKLTFKKICLSEQKNYVYLLSSFIGIGFLFFTFWYINLSNHQTNLFSILLYGVFCGPFLGVVMILLFSYIYHIFFNIALKRKNKFKNILSISAYSFSPVVITVIFILPTEVIMFGLYLFSDNPAPQTIKPLAFYILSVFNIMSVLYSVILLSIGGMVTNNIKYIKSLIVSFISLICFAAIFYLGMELVKKIL